MQLDAARVRTCESADVLRGLFAVEHQRLVRGAAVISHLFAWSSRGCETFGAVCMHKVSTTSGGKPVVTLCSARRAAPGIIGAGAGEERGITCLRRRIPRHLAYPFPRRRKRSGRTRALSCHSLAVVCEFRR